MTRAIISCLHAYTPFGQEFYQPLLDHFLKQLKEYNDEWDHLYLIEDDNWKLKIPKNKKITVVHVSSSLRYYDAYKEVLPQIKEDLVLLLDDDTIIYKPNRISIAFIGLMKTYKDMEWQDAPYDVVSIVHSIGTMKVPLKLGNKFCPFFFATKKELLMKYLDIDWGPQMPYTETIGLLTEAMLKDGAKVYEMEDDRDSIYFDGSISYTKPGRTFDEIIESELGQNLGYYHIRAGSVPSYLLSAKYNGHEATYWDYLDTQAKNEILRACAWYEYMGGEPLEIYHDLKVTKVEWNEYIDKFKKYHQL